jgi:hypothetical protein
MGNSTLDALEARRQQLLAEEEAGRLAEMQSFDEEQCDLARNNPVITSVNNKLIRRVAFQFIEAYLTTERGQGRMKRAEEAVVAQQSDDDVLNHSKHIESGIRRARKALFDARDEIRANEKTTPKRAAKA